MRIARRFSTTALIYLILLFLASVLPINSGTVLTDNYTLNIRWDYLLHAMVYFPLPLLMVLGWKRNLRMVWIVAVSLAVFVLFELIQRILPYRSFNINDMVANGVGVMLGWTGVLIFRKRLKLKEV